MVQVMGLTARFWCFLNIYILDCSFERGIVRCQGRPSNNRRENFRTRSELRTRRNTHSPISKLPTELLTEIFVLTKFTAYKDTHRGAWLNVACVCQHWRDIAVNEPRMWNTLDVSRMMHPDWAKIMLIRSKDASLYVRCPPSDYEPSILKLFIPHVARIQDLRIFADGPCLLEIMEIMVTHTTSGATARLQSLDLHNSSRLTTHTLDSIHRVFGIVQMPLLLDLQLYGIALPLIPPMPLLRRFRYRHSAFGLESTTMAALLSSLRNTPCLEDLAVTCAFNVSDEGITKSGTVELPKLKSISLITKQFEHFSLLQCIRYPPSSLVRFESERAPMRIADIHNLSSVVSHFASSDVAVNINNITLLNEAGPELLLRLTAWINDVQALDIRCPVLERDALPLFKLCEMLPANNVRTFRINNFSSIKRDDWARVFRRFEQVQDLTARFGEVALTALLKSSEEDRPPFLQLKRLALMNCDFDSSEALANFKLSVKKLLQERVDLEIPIEVLKIRECKISEYTIQRLDEYECVSWDGLTLLDESDDDEDSDEYLMMF